PAEMSLRTLAAAHTTGIGMTSLPVLYRFGDFGSKAPRPEQSRFINDNDAYLQIVSQIVEQTADDPNTSFGIAPHSLRAVNPDLLDEVIDHSPNDNHPIHIHIAEQSKEVNACIEWSGTRPVEWLLTHYNIDHRWCLVHATHMTEAETKQLAQTGAVVGLCPSTEANLGDGLFNATTYIQSNGGFGIGSDSQISVNPVEELRWLEYVQRLHHQTRNVVVRDEYTSTGRFLFERSVSGGAKASGRKIGKLETGYRADFIVLDMEHPLLCDRVGDAVLDSWIFSGNANVVRHVFVGGHQVIKDGVHDVENEISSAFKNTLRQLSD
ncbi:MAG: formimidoylglutamate deiminase, partial [Arenicellales bacterium]|nr:formimidoylglutamate deiminase [Arenicellales bacterium]